MTSADTLGPFLEWGGPTWRRQLGIGLEWLGDVEGMRVLDVGTRNGRMATWFGLQGASVVGVDIVEEPLREARRFAEGLGVDHTVTFQTYSGDPFSLPTGFDIVFAKSVVVLMDIESAVAGFSQALRPGGRMLLMENARGPLVLHAARMIRRASLHPHGAHYVTPRTLEIIGRRFTIDLEHWSRLPPTVVVGATKRPSVPLTGAVDAT